MGLDEPEKGMGPDGVSHAIRMAQEAWGWGLVGFQNPGKKSTV